MSVPVSFLLVLCAICVHGFTWTLQTKGARVRQHSLSIQQSYLDELNLFKAADKKVLVGFTTDAWNIGQRKYKDFLAVHKMTKKIQKQNIACVEVPMWYVARIFSSCPCTFLLPSPFSFAERLLYSTGRLVKALIMRSYRNFLSLSGSQT